jgi:glycosyltransferase involved in cell wall biosynthesis
MKHILIGITTYNRPDMLMELLHNILLEAKAYKIKVIVLNDGSTAKYGRVERYLEKHFEGIYKRFNGRHGKPLYWALINHLFTAAKQFRFDYFIQLPDDVRLVEGFFDKAIAHYEAIPKHSRLCMNLLNDGREYAMWTPVDPVRIDFAGQQLIRIGWVDMCYIAERTFFDRLEWTMKPIDIAWSSANGRSSGVGMQISRRIVASGGHFYLVGKSLVIHDDHQSVMHTIHRKIQPLITNNI